MTSHKDVGIGDYMYRHIAVCQLFTAVIVS